MVEMVESTPSVTRAVMVVEARVMICVTTCTAGVTCWRGSRGWMIAIIYYFVSVKYLTRMTNRGVCLRMASRSLSKMVVGGCEGTGGAQQGAGWELSFWRGSLSTLYGMEAALPVWMWEGASARNEAFFPHSLLEQCLTSPGEKSYTAKVRVARPHRGQPTFTLPQAADGKE